jgi:acyl dehydratase
MKTCYFEDFKPGDRFESPGMTMTESAIIDFAARFDPQPFHMDRVAAEKSIYGGLIASGIHTVAVTFRLLLQTGALANNLGSPGFDELRWLRPVRPGDTLRAVGEVVEVRPSASRPDRGTVRFRCTTLNQNDEPVQAVYCNQLLQRRPTQSDFDTATGRKR